MVSDGEGGDGHQRLRTLSYMIDISGSSMYGMCGDGLVNYLDCGYNDAM